MITNLPNTRSAKLSLSRQDFANIMTPLLKGDILNSRYQILGKLTDYGHAYLAKDANRSNKRCVLKEFAPRLRGSFVLERAKTLFEQEAGILYQLKHPQISKLHELIHHKREDQGCLLLVQDYVKGRSYCELFNKRTQSGSRFPEAEIGPLIYNSLRVLDYIHSMGVIHGAISPEHIISRSSDDLPVLIGFGGIKEVENAAYAHLMNEIPNLKTSYPIATAIDNGGYAPPEQVKQGIVFPHSDLYALAATAVVLLTGKAPQQLMDLKSHRWNWQKYVTLSPNLEHVLTTMLSPLPADRYQSAAEVTKALQETLILTSTPQGAEASEMDDLLVNRHSSTRKHSKLSRVLSKPLLFAPLVTTAVIAGFLGFKARVSPVISSAPKPVQTETQLSQRLSQGETVLISQTTTPLKDAATLAFARKNYDEAASLFSTSLETLPNDPEALIYLNNARIGEEESYTIAVSVPIGSNVNTSQEILRGVAQAQTEVNQAGGINGIPLKVQIVNDDDNPEIAKQVAAALGQNPDILGVVGHASSDVTSAAANVYQSAELVAISPVSSSVKLSSISPYIFRTVPSDYVAARALADHMLNVFKQRHVAVFFNSQSAYSLSLKGEFVTAVSLGGGQVVNEFDLSDADFSAVDRFLEAVQSGADVLMFAANSDMLDRVLEVVQVNQNQLQLMAGNDVYSHTTLEVAGKLAENMVLTTPWHLKSNPNAEFVQFSRQLWRADVNWRTAMAYDAASAFIAGIDYDPTRTGMQQRLSNPTVSFPGAIQEIKFLPSGDRLTEIQLVTVKPSDRNASDYEFMPVSSPLPGKT